MALAHRGDVDVAVGGLHGADRHIEHLRRAAFQVMLHHLGGLERRRRLHQRAVDIGALAETELAQESRGNRLVGVKAGHHVDGDHTDALRRAGSVAVDRHPARKRLDHGIRHRQAVVGAVLAEAGDREVDHFRIDGLHLLVADAEARHDAGAEALDHDVRPRGELEGDLLRGLVLHVHGERFLAAVEHDGMGALVAIDLAERAPPVAVERLQLGHFRAVLGQQHGAVRAGDALGGVEDLDALQGHGGRHGQVVSSPAYRGRAAKSGFAEYRAAAPAKSIRLPGGASARQSEAVEGRGTVHAPAPQADLSRRA